MIIGSWQKSNKIRIILKKILDEFLNDKLNKGFVARK